MRARALTWLRRYGAGPQGEPADGGGAATRAAALAERAMAAEDWPTAVEGWRTALGADPTTAPAHVHAQLGRALQKAGDLDAAGAAFERGLELHPGDPTLMRRSAELATTERAWLRACDRWQALLDEHPSPAGPQAYAQLGRAHINAGRTAVARTVIERGLETAPSDLSLLMRAAELAMRVRDWDEAAHRWRSVLATGAADARANAQLVHSLLGAGAATEAVSRLQEGLEQHPDDLALQELRSAVATISSRYEITRAIKGTEVLLCRDPERQEPVVLKRRPGDGADERYERILALYAERSHLLSRLKIPRLLGRTGDYDVLEHATGDQEPWSEFADDPARLGRRIGLDRIDPVLDLSQDLDDLGAWNGDFYWRNMLFTPTGHIWLLDWETAKFTDAGHQVRLVYLFCLMAENRPWQLEFVGRAAARGMLEKEAFRAAVVPRAQRFFERWEHLAVSGDVQRRLRDEFSDDERFEAFWSRATSQQGFRGS